MRLPKARTALLLMAAAAVLLLPACGSRKGAGDSVPIPRAPAAAIADPAATVRIEADRFLKQERPLYMEPQEVLARVVTGSDQGLFLVDVRNDAHYAKGHIAGAVNIPYADVWREGKIAYLPRDKKIVVIDYSGHTASQVAAFWGMLGYDTVAMRNGMAGWTRDREVIGGSPLPCEAAGYPVTTAVRLADPAHELPRLETQASSLAGLLMSRAQEATEAAPVIQAKDFLEKAAGFYVVDIRQPAHYQAGHIEGAVNIPFRGIAEADNLKRLPADKNIVLVCYDGHAASQAARILNMLGYHATVLKDGMGAWVGDERVIGAKPIGCNVGDNPVIVLNAPLQPGPSAAAT